MPDPIYLDHAATTPVDPDVREAMLPFLGPLYGNPSSIHAAGRVARRALNHSRERVAAFVGAAPETLVFTSGGTEADALALWGTALSREARGERGHIVTSAIEHPAVLEAAELRRYLLSACPPGSCGGGTCCS